MIPDSSRRNLLRGKLRRIDGKVMRPPGASVQFDALCDDCGACARACPEGIVVRSDSGGPVLDFSYGACTFCNQCVQACPTGALTEEASGDWPWTAKVLDSCLSLAGVTCRACDDACAPRAIRFRLMTGGRALPDLDPATCTGCGACAHTCPAGAIAFTRHTPAKTEMTA
ncbi:ferredoxin-type protein NapF [Palleronia caenipelagi]|uniref:Ferredoxin-type protein NapF n=1 Tax=Palleronia caenipelagi TaxID=2489174 RepID=A0A547QA25_9RHOB|nr:ferredoxin-type protein NapF [Palleronia caenipelagi]TRD23245.1 ferredoxin-type protein NapF [Palleronia caenipelagi]